MVDISKRSHAAAAPPATKPKPAAIAAPAATKPKPVAAAAPVTTKPKPPTAAAAPAATNPMPAANLAACLRTKTAAPVATKPKPAAAAAPATTKPKPAAAAVPCTTKPMPTADLAACLRTMTLQDPPLPRRPQPQPRTEPLLQVAPPVPPAATVDTMQQFEMIRQHWPQSPQKPPPSRAVGENSASAAAAEYASILGSRSPSTFLASHFGACSPRSNPLAAQFPSVSAIMAPPSVPSSSTNHYQPMDNNFRLPSPFPSAPQAAMPPGPIHSNASLMDMDPYASGTSTAGSSASFALHGNAGMADEYAFLVSQLYANNNNSNQVAGYREPRPGMMMPPAVPRAPTLAEVRASLLRGPMDPALAMDPETADHVVRLLHEGSNAVRLSVLAGVARAVHAVMESRDARDVFRTLLAACSGRFDELCAVVDAVVGGKGVLMGILKQDQGMAALKILIAAVGRQHELSLPLIAWMLKERLTDHWKCGDMVNHCFTRIPYDACSIMIHFAMYNMDALLASASGSIYVAECFANARNDELRFLEKVVLKNTSKIAMGQYSNYFLQRVIECGSGDLKELIAENVAADVANLSADKFGSYVVEACFVQTLSLAPMRSVITAFQQLPNDQLAELVRGGYSNYVVHKLLEEGKTNFPVETMAVARRIEKLPAAVHREMHAQRVMRVIKKLFPKKRRY